MKVCIAGSMFSSCCLTVSHAKEFVLTRWTSAACVSAERCYHPELHLAAWRERFGPRVGASVAVYGVHTVSRRDWSPETRSRSSSNRASRTYQVDIEMLIILPRPHLFATSSSFRRESGYRRSVDPRFRFAVPNDPSMTPPRSYPTPMLCHVFRALRTLIMPWTRASQVLMIM